MHELSGDIPKKCSKCKEWKTRKDFALATKEKSGLKSYCRACAKTMYSRYYAENKDRLIAQAGSYQKANPERTRGHARTTYARHRDSRLARKRDAYEKSKGTPDRANSDRARYEKNRAAILVKRSISYEANPEPLREKSREYRKANPARMASLANALRARKANASGSHTAAEWNSVKEYFGLHCAYCLRHESECGKLCRDHVLPLARGGSDDIDNIVPACRSCNSSKNAKTLTQMLYFKTITNLAALPRVANA